MVIYYSWKGHTKVYARELAALSQDTAFELTEQKKRSGVWGFISGCYQGIAKKETPVTNMPDLSKANEIFVCSPIWAAGIAPAVRYFINHAELDGIKVNFLLTCSNISQHEDFRKSALDALSGTKAIQGAAYVFAGSMKNEPDIETVKSHIKKVILGVD